MKDTLELMLADARQAIGMCYKTSAVMMNVSRWPFPSHMASVYDIRAPNPAMRQDWPVG